MRVSNEIPMRKRLNKASGRNDAWFAAACILGIAGLFVGERKRVFAWVGLLEYRRRRR